MEYVFYFLAFFITFLTAIGIWIYFKSQRKEFFETVDSQKDSRKNSSGGAFVVGGRNPQCSQADINSAVSEYLFGETTKTKI